MKPIAAALALAALSLASLGLRAQATAWASVAYKYDAGVSHVSIEPASPLAWRDTSNGNGALVQPIKLAP